MCYLEDFLKNLYKHLTETENTNQKIIRIHTRNLNNMGDLSFPTDIRSWCRLVKISDCSKDTVHTIFDYLSSKPTLLQESEKWPLSIVNLVVSDNTAVIYLDKFGTFKKVISDVLALSSNYGSINVAVNKIVNIETPENDVDFCKMSLTDLKMYILKKVTQRLLQFTNCTIIDEKSDATKLMFTQNAIRKSQRGVIKCGAVLNDNGCKDVSTTANELFQKRAIDMRLMAEHKYGLRISSLPGWKEFFYKLGVAAVTIHLLQNKPSHTTTVKLNNAICTNNKGGSFILYNCARLATLIKEFDKKVLATVYPPLPPIEDIQFNLLSEPEEWELLFVYILQFPLIIKGCIKDIQMCYTNPHYLVLFLSSLASSFSVYYRRIKILTEPREHLFPVLHQRIYLLKAVQQIFHNSLHLLDIEPVTQM